VTAGKGLASGYGYVHPKALIFSDIMRVGDLSLITKKESSAACILMCETQELYF